MDALCIQVSLGERSYPIHIAESFDIKAFKTLLKGRRFYIVTDSNVGPLYQSLFDSIDGKLGQSVIPAGEASKSLQQAEIIFGDLIRARADRKTVIVALGGGVVGDLAGFIASTYMREVPFIQVPTSLLAMVDSSVGGKVAVNHPFGKNMIGRFYQPEAVWMSLDVLQTLPKRELRSGLAEVVKYGVIMDAAFFGWLEQNAKALLELDAGAITTALEKSVSCKAEVVAQDECEGGLRAILNLGHTFAHAEEVLAGYGSVLHGEAVASGMMAAMETSRVLGQASVEDVARLSQLLKELGLPTKITQAGQIDKFWSSMQGDKKSLSGVVNFVLSRGIGACDLPKPVERNVIESVLSVHTLS